MASLPARREYPTKLCVWYFVSVGSRWGNGLSTCASGAETGRETIVDLMGGFLPSQGLWAVKFSGLYDTFGESGLVWLLG